MEDRSNVFLDGGVYEMKWVKYYSNHGTNFSLEKRSCAVAFQTHIAHGVLREHSGSHFDRSSSSELPSAREAS